jgi:dienelactone hydrolase
MVKRSLIILLLLCVFPLATGSASSNTTTPAMAGWWAGSYKLAGHGDLTFGLGTGRALVALGVGHAGAQTVPISLTRSRVRFKLPGRPAPLVFDGIYSGSRISGTVRQGKLSGSFRVRRGQRRSLIAPGFYSVGARVLGVVDDPYGPARLVDLDSGTVDALYPSGKTFAIGSGFATRTPVRGTARFNAGGAVVSNVRGRRLRTRQLEVRFPSGNATLSGTLTLPLGRGRHPAVAFVHGSGATTRAYLPDLQALLVRNGVAVLAYDKRGVGQSGGTYPGESPTATAIDVLARDASAAVRFLARQPEIDPTRVGLAGHSQAGWIMPLAASRDSGIRFLVDFSGSAVTADENDLYQDLAGQGEQPQELSDEEVDAQVLARGPGGVDPIPWIRKLRVPALWLYGGLDKHIPSRLSVRRLEPIAAEPGRDFSIDVYRNANHALVETKTGLTSEMLRSDRFAPGLFADVAVWLRKHRL